MQAMGMTLYIRFIMALGFGLLGLGVVLKVLLEQLFHDWDAFTDMGEGFKKLLEGKALALSTSGRTEDVMLEIEKAKASTYSTRLIDLKREQLREIDAVEHRLRRPHQPVVLEPIAPPPTPEIVPS